MKNEESLISLVLDKTDSTNKYLIEQIRNGAVKPGTSVLALSQTEGRGRLGRSFISPHGGIYLSIALASDSSMMLTAKAAVAVTRTIKQICHRECGIKWVNDIILDGKKVCGILAQGAKDMVVVGIGINYCTSHSDFPEDLKPLVTSLYDENSHDIPDMMKFAETLVANIIVLAETTDTNWLEEYKSHSILIGKEVNIIQADKIIGHGKVSHIDSNCALHVFTDEGEVVLNTGEVSIRFAN